jgi:hypothetical protein
MQAAEDTPDRASRRALLAFFAAEVVALPLFLVWGRHGWFTQDDWDFLSARTAGNLNDLFRAHFQHWVTLPLLVYRLMWVLAGMHSYTPYQALIVVLHLVAAALLLLVIRRGGVRPWLSTIAALAFLFFGAGAENILVAFQITFVGSFVFGLTQLLLADHDGPIDRRDWYGLLAGFAGLLCSGVAVTMAVIVGVAVLLRRGRRGWRVALFHTAPLGASYALWSVLAPKGQSAGISRSHSPAQVLRFVWTGIEAAFARLGQVPGIGAVLAVVLIVGLALLVRERGPRAPLGSLAVPVALLVGGVVFLVVTGVARAGQGSGAALVNGVGAGRARDSRYVYLIAAMALPALALAADALIRRRRLLAIPLAVLLLVGLPGNIRDLSKPLSLPPFHNAVGTKAEILAIPRLPFADQLRQSHLPVPIQAPRYSAEGLTYGWLIDNAGKLPGPGVLFPIEVSTFVRQLFLVPSSPTSAVHCEPVPRSSIRTLAKGEKLTFERGAASVAYIPLGGVRSALQVNEVNSSTVVALVGPLRVIIKPLTAGVLICA